MWIQRVNDLLERVLKGRGRVNLLEKVLKKGGGVEKDLKGEG